MQAINISFRKLCRTDFFLLFNWLQQPHVKQWWDPDTQWTLKLVQEKYKSYVNGYKLVNGELKSIWAYVIYADEIPVGYIQVYNVYDFPRRKALINLLQSLAAIDIYIGEKEYTGRGLASVILKSFFEHILDRQYKFVFVDPNTDNIQAIRAYEKIGFEKVGEHADTSETWMLYENKH